MLVEGLLFRWLVQVCPDDRWGRSERAVPAGLSPPVWRDISGRTRESTGEVWGQCRCPDKWNS